MTGALEKASATAGRTRVLMFAEAVTLAHLARPLSLASSLDPARYEVVIACDPRSARFMAGAPFPHVPIRSVSSADFLQALAKGRPVYDTATLASYVDEDLRVIESSRPDVVVGDFRLSLSVSARLAGVPYVTITNGYWSPACREPLLLPQLPMTRWLPLPIASTLFKAASPLAMRLHCRPLNALRRAHGMTGYGADIRLAYTDADHVLCADAQPMIADADLPSNHSHLGPLGWSPPVARPAWWGALSDEMPSVYVTLGSSGSLRMLETVLTALGGLLVQVLASTAGAKALQGVPGNARLAPYLDGQAASDRSSLVICNGGSPTTQQALMAGVPVLGLPSNMDQMLNMRGLVATGAGESLRADRASVRAIRESVVRLLTSESHRAAARRSAEAIRAGLPAGETFNRVVARLLPSRSA